MKNHKEYEPVARVARGDSTYVTRLSHADGPSLEGAAMRLRPATATCVERRREQRPSKAALDELEQVLRLMADAVGTCVRLQRWDDLRASVVEYGRMLGVDPGRLLTTLLFRDFTRRILALPAPELAKYADHAIVGYALTTEPMPLDAVITMLIDARRTRPTWNAFDALESSGGEAN